MHSKHKIHKIQRFIARKEFFTRIEIDVPVIILFLKYKVLPVYNELLDKSIVKDKTNKNKFRFLDWDYIKHANGDYYSELIPLKDILNKWSDKYNLFDDWIIESALNTLSTWSHVRAIGWNEPKWENIPHTMYPSPFPRKCHRLNFNHSGWDPVRYAWKQAKKIITDDFKHFLEEEYYRKVSMLVEKAGIKPPIVKRQMQRHINWLLDYQVHIKEYKDICKKESGKTKNGGIDDSTIIKGITSIAKLINLTLRNK